MKYVAFSSMKLNTLNNIGIIIIIILLTIIAYNLHLQRIAQEDFVGFITGSYDSE